MRVSLLAALAVFTACGSYTASLPDGGRGLVNCPGSAPSVPVLVNDPLGAPAPTAKVTAVWLSYDQITQSFATDGRGIALVPSQFGPGIVRVTASLNDLSSGAAEITFSGGECVTAATPNNVVLQLK